MISVVIPTLNEEAYLPKLLECLAGQPLITEIIVVDGSSNDQTIEVAKATAQKLLLPLSTAIVRQRDVAVQRNHGAQMATNKWLLFFDADVTVPKDFARCIMDETIRRKLELAGTKFFAAENKLIFRSIYWLYAMMIYPAIRLFNPILHGCSILVTKELHEKIGGFEPGITFEDYDYTKRASLLTKPVLLNSSSVRTSARRFYNASFADIIELLGGTFRSILANKKIQNENLVHYHDKTGNHPSPRY